jgi:hypothetical protein
MSNSFQLQVFHTPSYLSSKVMQLFRINSSARWKSFQETAIIVWYNVGR